MFPFSSTTDLNSPPSSDFVLTQHLRVKIIRITAVGMYATLEYHATSIQMKSWCLNKTSELIYKHWVPSFITQYKEYVAAHLSHPTVVHRVKVTALIHAPHDVLGLTLALLEMPFFAPLVPSFSTGIGDARGTPPIPVP